MQKASGGMLFSLQPGSPAVDRLERAILALDRREAGAPRVSRAPTALVSGVIGWSLVARRWLGVCQLKQRFG